MSEEQTTQQPAPEKPLEFPRWVYPKDGSKPFVAQTPDDYDESKHNLLPTAAQNVTAETAEEIEDAKEEPINELDKLKHPVVTTSGHVPARRGGPRR